MLFNTYILKKKNKHILRNVENHDPCSEKIILWRFAEKAKRLTRFSVYVHSLEVPGLNDAECQIIGHRVVRQRRQQMSALIL